MKNKSLISLSFLLMIGFLARVFAHGENEIGPHGGFIQMPGAWHTELVLDQNQKNAKIYLLDIEFKNPTVKNSKLTLTLKKPGRDNEQLIQCVAKQVFYVCSLSKIKLKKGDQLKVLAERDGKMGGIVTYSFPLKKVTH